MNRGKEMSVSRDLGHYYKLPQIRPKCCLFALKCSNAVYLAAIIVYAKQVISIAQAVL